MAITCIARGCDNKQKVYSAVMFHRFPTHHKRRKVWLAALNMDPTTPVLILKNWRVCSEHFTEEDYTCTGLRLKDTATPTLLKSRTQQSASSLNAHFVMYKHISTQTGPEQTSTVGTQLSDRTLKEHMRSKGRGYKHKSYLQEKELPLDIQVSLSSKCVGVGSGVISTATQTPMFSTPLEDSRTAKRAKLEPLDENEKEEEVSSLIPDPQYSTHNPEDSVTESSELLPSPDSSYGESKYMVYWSCLLELFKHCPVCRRVCDINCRTWRTFLAVDQLCSHCHFVRKWKS